jgi:hypothetical protein
MQKPIVLRSIQRFITAGKRLPIYLGIFVTIFVLWLQIGAPAVVNDFVARLEYLIYDQRLSVMPRTSVPAENKIVIVDLDTLSREFIQTLEAIEPQINSDQYFADVMSRDIDVILAINFTQQTDATYNELPPSIVDIGAGLARRVTVPDMTGYTGNIKILQDAALGNGSMNQEPDADGIVRRVPLVVRYGSNLYPTLSLEMIRV